MNLVGGATARANATNSELTAQTLTFSDLQNQMQHSTSSGGIAVATAARWRATRRCLPVPRRTSVAGVPMHEKGGDSSTTYATLTEGTQVVLIQNSAANLTRPTPTTGAPRNRIQLMDGLYVVDGLKISDSYYERL